MPSGVTGFKEQFNFVLRAATVDFFAALNVKIERVGMRSI